MITESEFLLARNCSVKILHERARLPRTDRADSFAEWMRQESQKVGALSRLLFSARQSATSIICAGGMSCSRIGCSSVLLRTIRSSSDIWRCSTAWTASSSVRRDLRLKRVKDREIRRANIRRLNSFRGTWITIALNMGVVPEIVRKITGHTAMEVVLAHYYKPAREDIRRELMMKMPAFFNIGQSAEPNSPDDKSLLKAIETMTHEN